MLTSLAIKQIVTEARPIIERQLDDAERLAGLREVVAAAGGDWSQLKALIKAQIQDENDDAGDGKRVRKILDKAGYATAYADMLGLGNMNEKSFSADEDFDPETGEITDDTITRGSGNVFVDLGFTEQEGREIVASHQSHGGEAQGAPVVTPSASSDQTGDLIPYDSVAEVRASRDAWPDRQAAPISSADPVKPEGSQGSSAPLKFGDAKPLRPHCLTPNNCGGQGRHECWSCRKAAGEAA